MFIDDPGQGVGDNQRIIGFQGVDAETQKVGLNHIVMRGPLEVLSRGLEIDISQVPTGAHILLRAVVPDAGILRGKLAADVLAAVGGTIVRDDQLEIPKRLIQQGIDGGFEKAVSVVKKQADTEKGRGAHCVFCSDLEWAGQRGEESAILNLVDPYNVKPV
jgi:hypothetical protein